MISMSQENETFFTSIGCMDGRVQDPIEHFGQNHFHAKYPDTITEAGLVGLLSKKSISKDNKELLELIKKKILISLEKHHSKGIIVHGHQECAGNPVEDAKHKKDVLKAAGAIRSFVPKEIEVLPMFVKRAENNWIIEKLH